MPLTSADKDLALVCLDEGDKITCKVMTKRVKENRGVKFNWQSPASSEDNKVHTLMLPANHGSIHVSQDKEGRAKGRWRVTSVIDDEGSRQRFKFNRHSNGACVISNFSPFCGERPNLI